MNVTFPLFDLPSIRARKEIEHYHELAEAARYDQVLQDLNGEVEKAKAMLTARDAWRGTYPSSSTPPALPNSRLSALQSRSRDHRGSGRNAAPAHAD